MRILELDLLQTLTAFADSGSLAKAAHRVGRTPSAITSQIQRLEELAGTALLAQSGRGRRLTDAGDLLVAYARRMLALQAEAQEKLAGAVMTHPIRLGVTQDFVERDLSALLDRFPAHGAGRLDIRIGYSVDLAQTYARGEVDILLAVRQPGLAGERAILREPMCWITGKRGLRARSDAIPLAVLEPPCGFRGAALRTLGEAGRSFEIAAVSPSLTALRAVIRAGVAVGIRTRRWLDDDLAIAPKILGLPKLPPVEFALHVQPGASAAVDTFAENLARQIGARP